MPVADYRNSGKTTTAKSNQKQSVWAATRKGAVVSTTVVRKASVSTLKMAA